MSSSKTKDKRANREQSELSSPDGLHDHPRRLTAVACMDCRKRKRKCDGKRPTCSACANRGLKCVYETAEGHTRSGDLKSRVRSLTGRLHEVDSFIDQLRYGSDFDSSFILARLRTGESVTAILDRLNESINASLPSVTDSEHTQAQPDASNEWRFGSPMHLDALNGMLSEANGTVSSTSSEHTQLERAKRNTNEISPTYSNGPWAQSIFAGDQTECMQLDGASESDKQIQGNIGLVHASASGPTLTTPKRGGKISMQNMSTSVSDHAVVQASDNTDERVKQRQLFNDRHKIGDSITVSSNFFSSYANLTLHANGHTAGRMENLIVPSWAIMSMHHQNDDDEQSCVYLDFIAEKRDQIKKGVDPSLIFGTKPEVEAVMNEAAFARASDLSKWIARLVTAQEYPSAICRIVGMWLIWHLIRWHINPTPETYEALPQWYRPTPYQLFYLHPVGADFHVWPAFRDIVIQRLDLQHKSKYWWAEASRTIDCNWPGSLEDGICVDAVTGEVMLNPLLIQHAFVLENWTVDSCIRKYIPNADTYVNVKCSPPGSFAQQLA